MEPPKVPAARDRFPGRTLFALLESISFGEYEAEGRWAPTMAAAKALTQDITSVDSREYRFFCVAPEHSGGYRIVRVVPCSNAVGRNHTVNGVHVRSDG